MAGYIRTVVGYSSAETRVDGASRDFPVPRPEEFVKDPRVAEALYAGVENFGTNPGAWSSRPAAVTPVYCFHDGVLADEKARDALRQPKILLLEASVTAAISAGADMQFTDVNTATAALLMDGAYSTFAVMHGGGKMSTAFCWDTGDKARRDQYYTDISAIYDRLRHLKAEDSPFHNRPGVAADLEKQDYWENFWRLPGIIRTRGIRVFKTGDAKELPSFDDLADSLQTHIAEKTRDLRQSVWDGIHDITGTLDKLAAMKGR